MPLATERMLALLAASEDALAALIRMEEILRRELELLGSGQTSPEGALANLELLLTMDGLLARPSETRVAIAKERTFYSPSRLGRNRRERARMVRVRASQKREDHE